MPRLDGRELRVDRLSLSRRDLLRRLGVAAGAGVVLTPTLGFAGTARANALFQGQAVTPEGSIILAQGVEILEMNPHRELFSSDSSLHFALFDSLVQRDDDMTLVPVLAESYENTGPTEWTIKLRQGISFHNGEPLTVETIQWNVEDLHREDIKREATLQNLDRVEKVDDATFKLFTRTPDPVLPQRLVRFFILPSQYFEDVGEDAFMENPVGTGAYSFVERVRDSHITITAQENYWRGNAAIKDVTIRIIPDPSTVLQALSAGEIDFMFSPPPDQFDILDAAEETKAVSVVSNRIGLFQFFPESPLGNGELRDPRVRQAINHAVNVDGIIEFLLGGHSTRIATILPPVTFAFDPDLAPYPYDPERARQLLAEAGFPDGFDLVVETPTTFLIPKPVEIGQVIQEDLAQVGITVDLRPTELATMLTERGEKQIAPMYFWSWGSDFLDPEVYYRLVVHSASAFAFYSKPEWDQLIDEAGSTLDAARREEIYKQLQAETFADPPALFMYAIENLYAMKNDVEMTPRTDERVIIRNMTRTGD